ncbi:hypothetical protein T260_16040 [Geobacillus thermopakistaniensis]|uniref:Uncharacterized protein n=1 Tax=Geobacillus thermopakistaniensis (strain MAS1) TaxID=1408282 RepID=A0A7U9J8T2_GEOTM|nr:hypothetical protein T260_16040 [Geobacillus sp. MAS1]
MTLFLPIYYDQKIKKINGERRQLLVTTGRLSNAKQHKRRYKGMGKASS